MNEIGRVLALCALFFIRTSSGFHIQHRAPIMMMTSVDRGASSKSALTRALKALERRKAPQTDAVAAFVASPEATTAADARMLLHLARRRYSGAATAHTAAVAESAALVLNLHSTAAWDAGLCYMLIELVGEMGWVNAGDAGGRGRGRDAVSAEQILESVPPSRMDEKAVSLLIRLFGQRGNVVAASRAFARRREVARVPVPAPGRRVGGENPVVWNTYLSTLLDLRRRRVGGVDVARLLRATKAAIVPDAYTASSALQHAVLALTRRPAAGHGHADWSADEGEEGGEGTEQASGADDDDNDDDDSDERAGAVLQWALNVFHDVHGSDLAGSGAGATRSSPRRSGAVGPDSLRVTHALAVRCLVLAGAHPSPEVATVRLPPSLSNSLGEADDGSSGDNRQRLFAAATQLCRQTLAHAPAAFPTVLSSFAYSVGYIAGAGTAAPISTVANPSSAMRRIRVLLVDGAGFAAVRAADWAPSWLAGYGDGGRPDLVLSAYLALQVNVCSKPFTLSPPPPPPLHLLPSAYLTSALQHEGHVGGGTDDGRGADDEETLQHAVDRLLPVAQPDHDNRSDSDSDSDINHDGTEVFSQPGRGGDAAVATVLAAAAAVFKASADGGGDGAAAATPVGGLSAAACRALWAELRPLAVWRLAMPPPAPALDGGKDGTDVLAAAAIDAANAMHNFDAAAVLYAQCRRRRLLLPAGGAAAASTPAPRPGYPPSTIPTNTNTMAGAAALHAYLRSFRAPVPAQRSALAALTASLLRAPLARAAPGAYAGRPPAVPRRTVDELVHAHVRCEPWPQALALVAPTTAVASAADPSSRRAAAAPHHHSNGAP